MTVLVIEDDKTTLKALKFALNKSGKKVLPASNLANASNQLKNNKIDCVISDVNLPDSKISDFVQTIRQGGHGTVPVILISSDLQNSMIDQTLLAGADAFIPKPVNFDLLNEVLERLSPNEIPAAR